MVMAEKKKEEEEGDFGQVWIRDTGKEGIKKSFTSYGIKSKFRHKIVQGCNGQAAIFSPLLYLPFTLFNSFASNGKNLFKSESK